MSETMVRGAPAGSVTIRSYRPTDHHDCRALWAEFAEVHRTLYEQPPAAASDPGAAFEEYLTRLDLAGMWVADETGSGVVGFVGLILDGRCGEVEPVVVTASHRGQGIGRALLEHVAQQARGRGLRQLTIAPDSRNLDAIRCLHAAGYDALANVRLAIDLSANTPHRRDGLDLLGLRFRY